MKKYFTLFLLLLSLSSYSQVDSTKVWEAREVWRSNTENLEQARPMPDWDLDGNIISIVSLAFLSGILLKKRTNSRIQIN